MTINESLEIIHDILLGRQETVSTAESCTSGRIAALLTTVSGASGYVQGGLVAYQDKVKVAELGVSQKTIDNHDVVSEEVVTEMVKGACRKFGTTYALASTGYAEAWAGHEVHIWIGWGRPDDVKTLCLTEDNGRIPNVENAASHVIEEFAKSLQAATM